MTSPPTTAVQPGSATTSATTPDTGLVTDALANNISSTLGSLESTSAPLLIASTLLPATGSGEVDAAAEVFFTLGKFDFSADTPVSQWLAVFLVPAVYFTILLVTLVIDVPTCARCCAKLRHGKRIADKDSELDTSAPVGHRQHVDRDRQKKLKKKSSKSSATSAAEGDAKVPKKRKIAGWKQGAARRASLEEKVESSRAEAQKAYVFELVKQGRVFLGPKAMFLMHKRRFKNFNAGAGVAAVPEPQQQLRIPYASTRRSLYCTFLNTVFATALRPSVIIMCVAGLWSWGVFAFRSMVDDETLEYIDNDRDTDNTFSIRVATSFNSTLEENIAYFLQNLDRMASLTALVQSYMSFMLVFYALQSLLLWNRTYAEMRALGVQFEKIALLFSGFGNHDDDRTRQVKFRVFRYLNLLHFLMYTANVEFLLSDFKNILTRQLVRVGLLEQREKEVLDDSQFPIATVNSWLTSIFWDRSQWLGPRTVRLRLLSYLTDLNSRYTDLSCTINSSPPYSWAQLMRLMVDVYMLLTPFAFVSDMYMANSEAQIWPVVGTFVVSMFLQGLMSFVRFLKAPFGKGRDAFNPDAVLLDTERRLLFYLSYHNDDSIYSPDSPEKRYRAVARAAAEKAKLEKLQKEDNPEVFFGADE